LLVTADPVLLLRVRLALQLGGARESGVSSSGSKLLDPELLVPDSGPAGVGSGASSDMVAPTQGEQGEWAN
jgi:hypothetical protein